jgi:hypothetical protein
MEATSFASRATRGSTGTLAAHGAREERLGRRRHPSRKRSGLHTVRGGGKLEQDVVHVTDMDGESDFLLSSRQYHYIAVFSPSNTNSLALSFLDISFLDSSLSLCDNMGYVGIDNPR